MTYLLFRRKDPNGVPSFDVVKETKFSDLSAYEGATLMKVIEAATDAEMSIQVRQAIAAYVYAETGAGVTFGVVDKYNNENPQDILKLRAISKPSEYGTMCRLAREMEYTAETGISGCESLWEFLQSLKFGKDFIETIAKPYWETACDIISETPYGFPIVGAGFKSHCKLMAYLLRRVCSLIENEGQTNEATCT